jgi:predicted aconitase with swiveling domain
MNLTLVVPEFKILARYQLDGKILLLPIRGRGSASGRTDVLLAKNVKGVGTSLWKRLTGAGSDT